MTSRDITYFLELRRQKIVQASCSCQFLACLAIMFYFPPEWSLLRSTIFVYSDACKAKSLQGMRISLIQTQHGGRNGALMQYSHCCQGGKGVICDA